jgi:cation transport protein ChaC
MTSKTMRLSPGHLALVPPYTGESGRLAGRADLPSPEEYEAILDHLIAGAPPGGDIWIFAYGSLIWNPEFDYAEERLCTAHGWRRSFCVGWVRIYRGTPERPGIMLGLDRGGSCKGVVFRLAPEAMRENLLKMVRREMPIRREKIGLRWMTVRTDKGPVRAIGLPVSRDNPAYLPDVPEDQLIEALATANGERGSMAEYLYQTVTHLEERGIRDGYLWRMQALVAARIEALYGAPS